jgi:hypothetical protein
MDLRRRVALGWGAILGTLLAGGCSALLGDFNKNSGESIDAGDATTDDGATDSALPPDTEPPGDTGTGDAGPEAEAGNCSGGADCSEAGSCQTATIVCSGGTPVCTDAGNAPNGQTCGTGLYCDNGVCAACTNGAPCEPPAKPCDNGSVVCADGGLTCNDLGTHAAAGLKCGTNLVCDGTGNCVAACTPANCTGGCCDPATQLCTLYAKQTGTSCGHAGAQCHSCAVGTSTPACTTSNGTCAGTLIGQIAGYSDVIDLDTDGTYVYFIDAANEEVGQVSAYSLGTPVVLSGMIGGIVSVVYDSTSSVVVFNQQASASTTALYKATPNVANSAVKFATVNGYPGSNAIAISSLGEVDALTALNGTTAAANNCSITGLCAALNPTLSSSFINGVTWAANQTEPYWADQANGKVLTYSPSCSCYTTFATATSPAAPINDGTYVYWLQVTGTLQIQRAAIAGGAVQSLGIYGDDNQVQNLTTDGKYLYWSGKLGGVAGIFYMPVAGGTAQLLTTVPEGMPVRAHKENTTGQMVVYYGDTTNATVDKVIAPP